MDIKVTEKDIKKRSGFGMAHTHGQVFLFFTCAFLVLSTFIFDLMIPLGVAGGVPYIAAILVTLWIQNRNFPVYLAILCSLLTMAGFFLSEDGGEIWKVLMNRGLALFAIWVTAALVRIWKLESERNFHLALVNQKAKEEIYTATVRSAQHIINNLLHQLQVVDIEAHRSSDFDPAIVSQLHEMTDEANQLMKHLSQIAEVTEENIRASVNPDDPPPS